MWVGIKLKSNESEAANLSSWRCYCRPTQAFALNSVSEYLVQTAKTFFRILSAPLALFLFAIVFFLVGSLGSLRNSQLPCTMCDLCRLTYVVNLVLDTTFINEYVRNWVSANESLFSICVGFVLQWFTVVRKLQPESFIRCRIYVLHTKLCENVIAFLFLFVLRFFVVAFFPLSSFDSVHRQFNITMMMIKLNPRKTK